LGLVDAALSLLDLWVIVARSLVCDVELSDSIVASSGAGAAPLPGLSNSHILAVAGLNISEYSSWALKGLIGTAIAHKGRLSVVDSVQTIAVGKRKDLGEESCLSYVSCAGNSCVGGAVDSDGLIEGLDSGLRTSRALAFKICTLSNWVADAVALVGLSEAADWASGDQLSGNRRKAASAVLG